MLTFDHPAGEKWGNSNTIGFAYETGEYYCIYKTSANGSRSPYGKNPVVEKRIDDISLEEWVLEHYPAAINLRQTNTNPGEYFQRIWRPPGPVPTDETQYTITQSIISAKILVDQLNEIFVTIEPSVKNQDVYGHNIRKSLILACTEVESAWSGILRENAYPTNRWSTNDYSKLCEPMFLRHYQVSLRMYPDFPSFKPFQNWDSQNPTKSLVWYDAYNKTKHNRELNFDNVSLKHVIYAVGAALVMLYAQFGLPQSNRATQNNTLDSTFEIRLTKAYSPELFYIPRYTVTLNRTKKIPLKEKKLFK